MGATGFEFETGVLAIDERRREFGLQLYDNSCEADWVGPAPRDELLLPGSTSYERFLAREDLDELFDAGRATPADVRALIADCRQLSTPGFDCAARYRAQPATTP